MAHYQQNIRQVHRSNGGSLTRPTSPPFVPPDRVGAHVATFGGNALVMSSSFAVLPQRDVRAVTGH